jgi:hypothetical protein
MLKFKRPMWALFLCLLLAACGGGSSINGTGSNGNGGHPVSTLQPPMYTYGEAYLPQCRTASVIAASTDPQGSEIMQLPGTGNPWGPDPAGKVMQVCSSHVTVHMTQADFDDQVFRLVIDSEQQGQVGAIAFNQMDCPIYGPGAKVNVNTWVQGWGDVPPGFINLPTSTFNLQFPFAAQDGASVVAVAGTGEGGGNYGIAFGGELLVANDPQVGQVIEGSAIGKTSCTDATPQGRNGRWIQSTIDTVDHYGTATHPVVNTGLYEPAWGNVFNYTSAQYVGMTDYLMVHLTQNSDGSFAKDRNGNLLGSGIHYWALRTDRLIDAVPGAAKPSGWTNS